MKLIIHFHSILRIFKGVKNCRFWDFWNTVLHFHVILPNCQRQCMNENSSSKQQQQCSFLPLQSTLHDGHYFHNFLTWRQCIHLSNWVLHCLQKVFTPSKFLGFSLKMADFVFISQNQRFSKEGPTYKIWGCKDFLEAVYNSKNIEDFWGPIFEVV